MRSIVDRIRKAMCFMGTHGAPKHWRCEGGEDHDIVVLFRGDTYLVVLGGGKVVGAFIDAEALESCATAWCERCGKRVPLRR
jgi:hypothetical protein